MENPFFIKNAFHAFLKFLGSLIVLLGSCQVVSCAPARFWKLKACVSSRNGFFRTHFSQLCWQQLHQIPAFRKQQRRGLQARSAPANTAKQRDRDVHQSKPLHNPEGNQHGLSLPAVSSHVSILAPGRGCLKSFCLANSEDWKLTSGQGGAAAEPGSVPTPHFLLYIELQNWLVVDWGISL